MKRLMTATAISTLIASAAAAQTATVTLDVLDLNNDEFASFAEAQAWFPDLMEESFNDIDLNDDNRLDFEELQTAEAQTTFGQYEMRPIEQAEAVIVLDDDGDGFITIDDYRRAYPEFTDLSFEEIDLNDDNRVSYREHYELEAQEEIARYETTWTVEIATVDTDNDSFVSFDEMVAVMPDFPAESFEDIDLNDDNRVSSEEFYQLEAQELFGQYM